MPVSFTKQTASTATSTSSSEDTPTTAKSAKDREEESPMCPSCKKQLSNSVRIFRKYILLSIPLLVHGLRQPNGDWNWRIVSKPCGHVTCKTCFDTLVKPAKQCVECDKELKIEKDTVELRREGASFLTLNFLSSPRRTLITAFSRDWLCRWRSG